MRRLHRATICTMTAGTAPCSPDDKEGGFCYGCIPGRKNKGLHDHVQPPPAQYGTVLKGKGAPLAHAVAAGRLGLYHKGARPYLQGRRGFNHYRPERAGAARVPHQAAPPL